MECITIASCSLNPKTESYHHDGVLCGRLPLQLQSVHAFRDPHKADACVDMHLWLFATCSHTHVALMFFVLACKKPVTVT